MTRNLEVIELNTKFVAYAAYIFPIANHRHRSPLSGGSGLIQNTFPVAATSLYWELVLN